MLLAQDKKTASVLTGATRLKPWLIILLVLLAIGPAWAELPVVCEETSYPHDPGSSTQGLVFYQGMLLESSGRYGHSAVRQVELHTGRVLRMHALPADVFAEGLALHQGVLYQLTWHNHLVFTYQPDTLEPIGRIQLRREAWGLASDGRRLVLSDGSAVLRFVAPDNFAETARLTVQDENGAVTGLNELEFVEGLLFANIYPTSEVVMIDPDTGVVAGRIDLGRYARQASRRGNAGVANGIAYDAATRCLLVTGKNWPQLYQIPLPRLPEPAAQNR